VNKTCRAIRREKLCLGSLLCELPAMLGLTHFEFNQLIPPWQRFQCVVMFRTA